jgi:hypothetical protein
MNKSTLATVGTVVFSFGVALGVHKGVRVLINRRNEKLREENMSYYGEEPDIDYMEE